VLVALFLGGLEYFLEEGPAKDWLESAHMQWVLGLLLVSGALFFWRELTVANPVIDLRAFRNRNFALGCLFSFVLGVGLYGGTYVTPLFLGRIAQYTPLQIGQTMMVVGIAQLFSGPIAGILSRRMDPRFQIGLGMTMFGSAIYLMSRLTHDSGYWYSFGPRFYAACR
jgi:DHA2 family multidrug resistance protein